MTQRYKNNGLQRIITIDTKTLSLFVVRFRTRLAIHYHVSKWNVRFIALNIYFRIRFLASTINSLRSLHFYNSMHVWLVILCLSGILVFKHKQNGGISEPDFFKSCNKFLAVQYISFYWHGSLNMDINGRCTL